MNHPDFDLAFKERVERAFVSELQGRIPELLLFPGRSSGDCNERVFAVFLVEKLIETTPRSGVHIFEAKFILVTDIDAASSELHSLNLQRSENALNAMPRKGADPQRGVALRGFLLGEISSVVEADRHGDVIPINGGVKDLKIAP